MFGGLLSVGQVAGGQGTSTFNFNGGTLQAVRDNASFLGNLSVANVRDGGAKIDTNNKNVALSEPLVHSIIPGDAGVDGVLTKLGAGMLTLAPGNTYTGGTRINAGILLFSSLDSMPTTGGIAVLSGGTLAVAAGGPGEFTNATSGANSIGGLLSGVGRNGVPVGFASGAAIGIDTTDAVGGLTYSGLIANPNGGANVLGLLKLGSGALTLTAANTYTGGTTINGGTIALSGAVSRQRHRSAHVQWRFA